MQIWIHHESNQIDCGFVYLCKTKGVWRSVLRAENSIDLPINSKTLSYVNEKKIALQLKGSLLDNTWPDYLYYIHLLFIT